MQELLLIALVALIVIGPERLPETLRTLGLWLGRLRRSFTTVKTELEKEIGMDEIRRQLHNEAVMEEMKRIERDVKGSVDLSNPPDQTAGATDGGGFAENSIDPGSVTESDAMDEGDAATQTELPLSEPDADKPLPRSEAELEALHASRMKKQASDQ